MEQDLNRIKLVLVEKKKTGKWLAQELKPSSSPNQDIKVMYYG